MPFGLVVPSPYGFDDGLISTRLMYRSVLTRFASLSRALSMRKLATVVVVSNFKVAFVSVPAQLIVSLIVNCFQLPFVSWTSDVHCVTVGEGSPVTCETTSRIILYCWVVSACVDATYASI